MSKLTTMYEALKQQAEACGPTVAMQNLKIRDRLIAAFRDYPPVSREELGDAIERYARNHGVTVPDAVMNEVLWELGHPI